MCEQAQVERAVSVFVFGVALPLHVASPFLLSPYAFGLSHSSTHLRLYTTSWAHAARGQLRVPALLA